MSNNNQSEYDRGMSDYKKGYRLPCGAEHSAEFLQGYHNEERNSRCSMRDSKSFIDPTVYKVKL